MNGDLPMTLVDNFDRAKKGKAKFKMWAYHGHREMSYAILKFLGINYGWLTRRGIPTTAIPAGTTLFLELHKTPDLGWIVQVWVWAPCIKDSSTGDEFHALSVNDSYSCPAQLIKLEQCDEQCPYDKFKEIVFDFINKTGTWRELCSEDKVGQILDSIAQFKKHKNLKSMSPDEVSSKYNLISDNLNPQVNGYMKMILLGVTITGILGVLCFIQKKQRLKYTYIPEPEEI